METIHMSPNPGALRGIIGPSYPIILERYWQKMAHRRLDHALQTAAHLPFDDRDRFIFFSDQHRGDGSSVDDFAPNRSLFLEALRHYQTQGFSYIEVGDGDELWKTKYFAPILRANRAIFDLFHMLHADQRLHLIAGNHDTQHFHWHNLVKDNIPVKPALLMQHKRSGQQLFITHGHQADLTSAHFYFITRLLARSIWRRLQEAGRIPLHQHKTAADLAAVLEQRLLRRWFSGQVIKIEERLLEWVQQKWLMTICGHTHLSWFAEPGTPPYFNTGCCLKPGLITGLEIADGAITPIRWTNADGRAVRELQGPARPLQQYHAR